MESVFRVLPPFRMMSTFSRPVSELVWPSDKYHAETELSRQHNVRRCFGVMHAATSTTAVHSTAETNDKHGSTGVGSVGGLLYLHQM